MILVTGSAGHLGEAMMRTFRAAGVSARGMDIKPSPYTDIVASIDDPEAVPQAMDRVYVNRRAREALGWAPRHDFAHVLDCLADGTDFRSDLARAVGKKGYHDELFEDGPFPVE